MLYKRALRYALYDFWLVPTVRGRAEFGANLNIHRRIVPAVKTSSYIYNNVSIPSLHALMPSTPNAFLSYKNKFQLRQTQPQIQSIQMLEPLINPHHPVESIAKLLRKVISYEI